MSTVRSGMATQGWDLSRKEKKKIHQYTFFIEQYTQLWNMHSTIQDSLVHVLVVLCMIRALLFHAIHIYISCCVIVHTKDLGLARQHARTFNTDTGKRFNTNFSRIYMLKHGSWSFFSCFLARVPTTVTGFNHANSSRPKSEGPQTEITAQTSMDTVLGSLL